MNSLFQFKVCFKRLIPHFLLIFAFVAYVCLGGVGFYYILKPHYAIKSVNVYQKTEEIQAQRKQEKVEDYVELTPDCPSDESKIVIERSVSEHLSSRKSTEQWTYIEALVLSFYHMTTIGSTEFHYHSKVIQIFALAFTIFGLLVSFVTLADLSLLFHEAVYLTLNRIRKCCKKNPSRSRSSLLYNPMKPAISVQFTKRVNPLVFFAILFIYCTVCGLGFDYLSSKSYFTSFFDCFFLILGMSTKYLLTLPRHWFFVQLLYIFMGFIIVGALLRSLIPILEKVYGRRAQTVRIIEHFTVPDKVISTPTVVISGGKDSYNSNGIGNESEKDRLLYSIASDSIPFADDKMSVVTSSMA